MLFLEKNFKIKLIDFFILYRKYCQGVKLNNCTSFISIFKQQNFVTSQDDEENELILNENLYNENDNEEENVFASITSNLSDIGVVVSVADGVVGIKGLHGIRYEK